jgi:hypothetical protein
MKAFTDNVFAGLKIFCVSSGLLEFFEFWKRKVGYGLWREKFLLKICGIFNVKSGLWALEKKILSLQISWNFESEQLVDFRGWKCCEILSLKQGSYLQGKKSQFLWENAVLSFILIFLGKNTPLRAHRFSNSIWRTRISGQNSYFTPIYMLTRDRKN